MKSLLLLCGLVAVLLGAGPAGAQYIYLDTNGDGVCNTSDLLYSAVTSMDVYLNTNHSFDGSIRTCFTNPSQPLDIFSYDIVVHYSGPGSVTFHSFTNAASGFALLNALTVAGQDAGVGYQAPLGGNLAPGLYKLGTFNISVTGNPSLSFVGVSSNSSISSFGTGFGTSCDASDFANTEVLGVDFVDNCGPAFVDDVKVTTWGKIKQTYR